MFKIEDGREHFFQWDKERKLIVNDKTIKEVHFCNRTDNCSLVVETYTENGLTLANVPNILLTTDWRINVYGYDTNYTKHKACFEVVGRTKPADYVYTETEIKNYEKFEERLKALEEKSNSGEVDLSEYAKKEYVDNSFIQKQVGIFDSGATRGYVYYINTENEHILRKVSVQALTDSIPLRSHTGNFYVNSPSSKYECANKGYVDDAIGDIDIAIDEIIALQEQYIKANAADIKFYIDSSEYTAKENNTWEDYFSIQENVDNIGYSDYGDGLVRIYGGVFWLLYNDGTTVKPTDEIIADYNYQYTNV